MLGQTSNAAPFPACRSINPRGLFKMAWSAVALVLVIISAFWAPYKVVAPSYLPHTAGLARSRPAAAPPHLASQECM